MEHSGNWFEYNKNIINLDKIEGFRVHKITNQDVAYTEMDVKKGKWVLHAGYTQLDNFKTKDEALNVARDIIAGKHKVKMPK